MPVSSSTSAAPLPQRVLPPALERCGVAALSDRIVDAARLARPEPAAPDAPLVICEVSCGHLGHLRRTLDALAAADMRRLEVNLVGPSYPPATYGSHVLAAGALSVPPALTARHATSGTALPVPPVTTAPAGALTDERLDLALGEAARWCATTPGSELTVHVHAGARAYRDAIEAGRATPAHLLLTAGGRPRILEEGRPKANLFMGVDTRAGYMLWLSELFPFRPDSDLARQPIYHEFVPVFENATVEWLVHPAGDIARAHVAGDHVPRPLARADVLAGLDTLVQAAEARDPGQTSVWHQPMFDAGLAHDDIARLLAPQRPGGRSLYATECGNGQLYVEKSPLREDFAHRAVPQLGFAAFCGLRPRAPVTALPGAAAAD